MDDRFFTSFFPGEATICGRVLKAFTPYHYLLLRAIGSPFMDASGVNRPADLLVAVSACRNQFGKPVKLKPTFKDEATARGALNERRFAWGAAAGDIDNNDGSLSSLGYATTSTALDPAATMFMQARKAKQESQWDSPKGLAKSSRAVSVGMALHW